MKIAVILPTYDEKDNVEKIIQQIFALEIPGLELIVVDDNSPDSTARIIEKLKETNRNIHLIRRKRKMGLGTAYLEGFRFALDRGADYFFEIDADLSHDPKHIPHFLAHMSQYDLVIGSRYMSAGKIVNWNVGRRLVSRLGNSYARLMLGLDVRDLTTGYKCYRRKVIEHLLDKKIDAIGYVFQIETTYYAINANFRIKEIPITFTEREMGKSKFSFTIIRESFWKVLKLKLVDKQQQNSAKSKRE